MQHRAQKSMEIFKSYQKSRSGKDLEATWGVFARLGGKTCRKNAFWRAKAPKKCDLEESWERLETSWARLGGVLGGLGRRLGAPGGVQRRSWHHLGTVLAGKWSQVGIKLRSKKDLL